MTSSEEIRENVEEEKTIPHVNFREDPISATEPLNPLLHSKEAQNNR